MPTDRQHLALANNSAIFGVMGMNLFRNSAMLALAIAVSACGTENRGMETIKQPVVSRSDFVLDVNASGDGLSGSEVARLNDWFSTIRIGYGDRISVDNPNPYDGNASRSAVAAVAARYGLLVSDTAPVTAGEIAPGTLRVVVSRVAAHVPNCPDWSRPSQPENNGSIASNYGCATNSSLAAMIADPNDLIEGRQSSGVASTLQTYKSVDAYRKKEPTGAGALKAEAVGGK